METGPDRRAAGIRTPTKMKSNKSLKSIAKAIPGHLAPLIPGLESSQMTETKNTTNDNTARAAGLEPHYDIEHFVPDDEEGYRGLLNSPLGSHKPEIFAVRPPPNDVQQRKASLRKAVSFDTGSLIHACSQGQPVSITASYVDTIRHRDLIPNHMNQDQIIAGRVAPLTHFEREAPTTRRPSMQIPKVIVTRSSPTNADFDSGILDNTLLRAPPVCFKKKERRRQAKAHQDKMLRLLRSRSPSSFNSLEVPSSGLVSVEPSQGPCILSNVNIPRRARRNVEPSLLPFERYAYSLFG